MNIEKLKRQWPHIQAVSRSGLCSFILVTRPAMAAGGRAVKPLSSGDRTKRGNRNAPTKVTIDCTTRAILPILPMSPSASFDCLTS